jgi:hypothetical protein
MTAAAYDLMAIVPQGGAANKLHGEVGLGAQARIGCAGFIDLRNPRVLQSSERAPMALNDGRV